MRDASTIPSAAPDAAAPGVPGPIDELPGNMELGEADPGVG